jgi:hypothetical protein
LSKKHPKTGETIYTTQEAITEEKNLRDTARKGKNAF